MMSLPASLSILLSENSKGLPLPSLTLPEPTPTLPLTRPSESPSTSTPQQHPLIFQMLPYNAYYPFPPYYGFVPPRNPQEGPYLYDPRTLHYSLPTPVPQVDAPRPIESLPQIPIPGSFLPPPRFGIPADDIHHRHQLLQTRFPGLPALGASPFAPLPTQAPTPAPVPSQSPSLLAQVKAEKNESQPASKPSPASQPNIKPDSNSSSDAEEEEEESSPSPVPTCPRSESSEDRAGSSSSSRNRSGKGKRRLPEELEGMTPQEIENMFRSSRWVDKMCKEPKRLKNTCDFPGCGKMFARGEHLKRHRMVHSGDKPFPCPLCKKPFRRADNLSQHIKTHLNQARRRVRGSEDEGALAQLAFVATGDQLD